MPAIVNDQASDGPASVTRPMWASLERFERQRDRQHHFVDPVLPEEPGTVHAYPGGEPFRLLEPEYFEGEGPRALCGHRVMVRLPIAFNSRDAEACQDCVDLLVRGESHAPGGGRNPCQAVVQPGGEAEAAAYGCELRDGHRGPHRAADGATWQSGPEDFVPAPDGFA